MAFRLDSINEKIKQFAAQYPLTAADYDADGNVGKETLWRITDALGTRQEP